MTKWRERWAARAGEQVWCSLRHLLCGRAARVRVVTINIGDVMRVTLIVCVCSMMTAVVSCAPGGAPDHSECGTKEYQAGPKTPGARLQETTKERRAEEARAPVTRIATAVDEYDEALRAMQAAQELVAALQRGERITVGDEGIVRAIARHEEAAAALLQGLEDVVVTKETYATLTGIYGVLEQESAVSGVQCEAAAAWGETAWKMYDGDVARAKLAQAMEAADTAAEMEGGARAEQMRRWAAYVAGTLAEIHAAYLDEAAIRELGKRLDEGAPAEARFAWYAAAWEMFAQQGRLEDARRIGEAAARALPQHGGARRLNELLPAFQNVRPATKRFARARIEYLRRQKMGEMTVLDYISRAAGAR
ncbi:MAG: hypothetical protein N2595_07775 [bacterium]|nr:hypothetical protein [bacterium]